MSHEILLKSICIRDERMGLIKNMRSEAATPGFESHCCHLFAFSLGFQASHSWPIKSDL